MTMDAALESNLERHWYKKDVSLSWEGVHASFAVAQELFSSHTVDAGSLLLLRSLDLAAIGQSGTCVDFGCGYGVLGLAFKSAKPGWLVKLVDRDALAVEFSAWNARRLSLEVACSGGLDLHDGDAPLDLVLWNVPGKAGVEVIRSLANQVCDRLGEGGLVALVVVHPLAAELEAVAAARDDIDVVHRSEGSEHTVFHMKRVTAAPGPDIKDAFEAGVFDREPETVDTGLLSYRFVPVVGLPQYEGPGIATVLLTDAIEGNRVEAVVRALCVDPGQGHVPLYLDWKWPDCQIDLIDRDLLALRASQRAIGNQTGAVTSHFGAAGVFDELPAGYDIATVMLPHQLRSVLLDYWLDRLIELTISGGHIAVGGGSTEVSRMVSLSRKRPEVKLRNRDKRKGFSAAIFERR